MGMAASPIRVQFVTTSLMQGGAEGQVFLLATEMKRRGHDVAITTMRDAEAFEDELEGLGIPVHSLGMQRGVADPRGISRLVKLVRTMRPDVVHSHMVHANLLARVARLGAPMPVQISTAHNFTEGARWREIAYRLTDPLCDLTTNVCIRCVEHFVSVGATPRHRIRYVPNGLDLSRFAVHPDARSEKRRELGVPDDVFLWLSIGRLEEQKDYPNLLAAVQHLLHMGVARGDLQVVVAGSGALQDHLEADAAAADLPVRFLGDRSDVPELMAAADAYVMSSAWEGLPMVLLEAGAASLPAVVTDVGGNREIVVDGAGGAVVPARDASALAEAMRRLMTCGPEQLKRFGRELHDHVEAGFSLPTVVDQWEALYRELLARRGRR